jgi:hypothetical protein
MSDFTNSGLTEDGEMPTPPFDNEVSGKGSKRRQSLKNRNIIDQGHYAASVEEAVEKLFSMYSTEEIAKLREAELIKQRQRLNHADLRRERSGSTPASPSRLSRSSTMGSDERDFTAGRMPGKELIAGLTDTDRNLVGGILTGRSDFIRQDQKLRVQNIFNTIDTNSDGVLSASDFQHKLPGADGYLRLMWERIQYLFDFEQLGTVTIDDFARYFIISALNKANHDTSTVGSPLGVQIEKMHEIFQESFDEQLEDMYAHILAPDTNFLESSGKY